MKHLIAILFAACALAQTGSWPTAATDQDLIVAKTGATSTLSTGVNASTLTWVVADGSKFAQYSVIRAGDEFTQICSISTNTLTLCAGARGLVGSAASHLAGATVRDVVSEYHHNRLRVEIKAMQAKLLPATSGTSAPGTCAANRELFVDRDASPAPTLSICNGAGTGWTVIAGGGGSGDPAYTSTVTAQTSVTITAATHGKGALALAECFQGAAEPREKVGCTYTRADNGDMVFTFLPAFTGVIQIGAEGGGGGADASGYYLVSRATNAPTNAVNLGALTTGVLKVTVAGSVATPAVVSGTATDCVLVNGNSGACGSGTTYVAGASGGIVIDTAPNPDTIDIDTAIVPRKADSITWTGLHIFAGSSYGTPASASATCTTGTWMWDANFEYRCVATNTWKRSALSTW